MTDILDQPIVVSKVAVFSRNDRFWSIRRAAHLGLVAEMFADFTVKKLFFSPTFVHNSRFDERGIRI